MQLCVCFTGNRIAAVEAILRVAQDSLVAPFRAAYAEGDNALLSSSEVQSHAYHQSWFDF